MTAKECIKGRRSIRKFTNEPIPHDVPEDIILIASYAPSWKNTQIVRYIAPEGDSKNRLAKCRFINISITICRRVLLFDISMKSCG